MTYRFECDDCGNVEFLRLDIVAKVVTYYCDDCGEMQSGHLDRENRV